MPSPSETLLAAADRVRDLSALSPAASQMIETLLRVAAVEEATPSPLPYGSTSLNALMAVTRELARVLLEEGNAGV